jgi:hypothetical protein
MEHPLINDISGLSQDELMTKINDLRRKQNWAMRTNPDLARQIGMAIESFQNRYRAIQEEQDRKAKDSGRDYSDRIDVS